MTNFEASLILDAVKGVLVLRKIADSYNEDKENEVETTEQVIEALDRGVKALRLIDAGIDKILDREG